MNTDLQLKALLEEYSSLRRESLSAIGYRVQILAFTFASLAVVVAGLLTRNLPDVLTGIISLIVVPQIAKASVLMWLGEYHRSVRAGRYLRKVEEKINQIVGSNTLGWETTLATGTDRMSYPYVSVVSLLLGIGYVASVFGIFLLSFNSKGSLRPSVLVVLVICSALWEAISLAYLFFKWDKIRKS